MIGTLTECRRHLARRKRKHPAAPLITNLIGSSKSYPRATDDQRKEIANYMEKMMQGIEKAERAL